MSDAVDESNTTQNAAPGAMLVMWWEIPESVCAYVIPADEPELQKMAASLNNIYGNAEGTSDDDEEALIALKEAMDELDFAVELLPKQAISGFFSKVVLTGSYL